MAAGQNRVFETRVATTRLLRPGVVQVVLKANVVVSLADAQATHEAVMELLGDSPCVVLVDPRLGHGVTREARVFLSSPTHRKQTRAQAILVGSALSRVIGSFFLGLNKASFPIRLFTAEEDALAWLADFLPEGHTA